MNKGTLAMAMMMAQMGQMNMSGGYTQKGDHSHKSSLTGSQRKTRKSKNKARKKANKKNRK